MLLSHPDIVQGVAFGVPDDKYGEEVGIQYSIYSFQLKNVFSLSFSIISLFVFKFNISLSYKVIGLCLSLIVVSLYADKLCRNSKGRSENGRGVRDGVLQEESCKF